MTTDPSSSGEGQTRRVRVDLGDRAYPIEIGGGLIERCGALLREAMPSDRAIVLTDEHVAALHLERFQTALAGAGIEAETIILPPGEATKSFAQLSAVLDRMLEHGLERKTTVIAFGGGVIGDLAGFVAAIALRGVPFIQVPTTLLAQVDSSVGGKTAINVPAGKNLVGAFYQPKLVIADTAVLDTLPRRELLAGYAEVVKYGALGDRTFFEWLEGNGKNLLAGDSAARAYAVARCCEMKAEVVTRDERESGVRALLNLGHTFGHALESRTGYGPDLLHGEAVGMGMVMAFDLSVRLGYCTGQDAERFRRHLADVGMRLSPLDVDGVAWEADDLVRRMAKDKKVEDGKLTFILARSLGDAFITQDVPETDLRAIVETALAA